MDDSQDQEYETIFFIGKKKRMAPIMITSMDLEKSKIFI